MEPYNRSRLLFSLISSAWPLIDFFDEDFNLRGFAVMTVLTFLLIYFWVFPTVFKKDLYLSKINNEIDDSEYAKKIFYRSIKKVVAPLFLLMALIAIAWTLIEKVI